MSRNRKPIAMSLAVILVLVVVIVALGRVGDSGTSTPIALSHHQGPYAITLTLRPARPGRNTFTVTLRRGSRRVTPASVRMLVTMLDMSMPQQVVVLSERHPGVFRGTEDLGMSGHWQLELLLDHLPGKSAMTTSVFRISIGG